MAGRDVVAVVWHELTHSIDVVYVEGDPDTIMGTDRMAAQMAAGSRLDLVSTPNGTVLWVRPASA